MADNKFEGIYQFVNDKDDEDTQMSFGSSADKDPDAHGKVIELADKTGLPSNLVESDPKFAQAEQRRQDFNIEDLRKSKALQEWSKDPDNAALVSDELGFLGAAANTIKGTAERVPHIAGNLLDVATTAQTSLSQYVGGIEMRGTPGAAVPVYVPPAEYRERLAAGEQTYGQMISGGLQGVSAGYDPEATPSIQDVKDAPLRNVLPFIAQHGVMSIPDMIAAVYSLPAYFVSMVGDIAQDRATNRGVEDATFMDMLKAMPFAAASAALERIGATKAFGLDDVAVEDLKSLLKESGKATATEATTETVQNPIEYAGSTVGTGKFTFSEAMDQALAGFLVGAGVGGTVRATVGTGEIIARRRQEKTYNDVVDAINHTSRLDRIIEMARKAKVFDRSHSRANQLFQSMFDEGGIGEAQVDAAGLVSMLANTEGADINEIIKGLGISKASFDRAVNLSQDVTVKTSNLVSLARDNEAAHEAIRMNLRPSDTGITLTEGDQMLSDIKEQIGREADAAVKEDLALEDNVNSAQALYDLTVKQLDEAGIYDPAETRQMAEIVRSVANTLQYEFLKGGEDYNPYAHLNSLGFNITREGAEKPAFDLYLTNSLNELRTRKQTDDRKAMLDFIRDSGGVKKGGTFAEELKAMDITGRGNPNLFTDNGGEADNIPVGEFEDIFGVPAQDDGNGYVDSRWLLDQIREGSFERPPSDLDEIQKALDEMGLGLDLSNDELINALKGGARVSDDGKVLYHNAWHGSPYRFTEFSLRHLGKGEGAQVYGWGLYFTDTQSIAEWYRQATMIDRSSQDKNDIRNGRFNGKEVKAYISEFETKSGLKNQEAIREFRQVLGASLADIHWASAVGGLSLDSAKGLEDVRYKQEVLNLETELAFQQKELDRGDVAAKYIIEDIQQSLSVWHAGRAAVDSLTEYSLELPQRTFEPTVYEVELAPKDEEYLLWDKPMKKQSDAVRSILNDLQLRKSMTGEELYRALSRNMGSDQKASKFLLDNGIPGIKYLDGSSRASGKGNHNYVIFDDKLITIKTLYQKANEPETFEIQGTPEAQQFRSDFNNQYQDRKEYSAWDAHRVNRVINATQHANGQETRGEIGFIDPLDFLLATSPTPDSIAMDTKDLDVEELRRQSQTPFFLVENGQIVGHEGRHRMLAMARAGIRRTPVLLHHYNYSDNGPTLSLDLKGQDYGTSGQSQDIVVSSVIPAMDKYRPQIVASMKEGRPSLLFQSRQPWDVAYDGQNPTNIKGLYSQAYRSVQEMKIPAWKVQKGAQMGYSLLRQSSDGSWIRMATYADKEEAERHKATANAETVFAHRIEEAPLQQPTARGADIWAKLKSSGIKKEEVEWLGIENWLTGTDQKFSRDQVLRYIATNGVHIHETRAGDPDGVANPEQRSEDDDEYYEDFDLEWDSGYPDYDSSHWDGRADDMLYEVEHGDDYHNLKEYALSRVMDEDFDQEDYEAWLDDGNEGSEEDFAEVEYDSYITDYMRERAEEIAQQEYEDNPYYTYTSRNSDIGVEYTIYGNDDLGYSVSVDGNHIEYEIYDLSDAQDRAMEHARENGYATGDQLSPEELLRTQWNQRSMVTVGDQYDYRELKLKAPDLDGEFYNTTHFPDKNIIGFMRVNTRDYFMPYSGELPAPGEDPALIEARERRDTIYSDEETKTKFADAITEIAGAYTEVTGEPVGDLDQVISLYINTGEFETAMSLTRQLYNELRAKYTSIVSDISDQRDLEASRVERLRGSVGEADLLSNQDYISAVSNARELRNKISRFDRLLSTSRRSIDDLDAFYNSRNTNIELIRNLSLGAGSGRNTLPERMTAAGQTKVKTFMIDEAQSDWHQKGRKHGYNVYSEDEVREARMRMRAVKNGLEIRAVRIHGWIVDLHNNYRRQQNAGLAVSSYAMSKYEYNNLYYDALNRTSYVYDVLSGNMALSSVPISERDDVKNGLKQLERLTQSGYSNAEVMEAWGYINNNLFEYQRNRGIVDTGSHGAPNAPYKKEAWLELMMKRAFLEAVQKGHDAVAWPNARVLMDRWNSSYRELYENQYDGNMIRIAKKLSGVQPTRFAIDASGIQKEKFEDGDQAVWIVPISQKLKDKIHQNGYTTFQEGQGGYRGSFDASTFTLTLNDMSDKTTFIHEAGHLFLEWMRAAATLPNAPENVTGMNEAIHAYLGLAPGEWSRDAHEKWAEGFESYMQAGVAPSKDLRRAFAKYRQWMLDVYKTANNGTGLPPIDPELTEFFDRLLATEQEIAQAEAETGIKMPDGLLDLLEDPADKKAVLEAAESAHDEAMQEQYQRHYDAERRKKTKWWREAYRDEFAKAKEELLAGKIYGARSFLMNGEFPTGETPEDMVGLKIDSDSLVEVFGEGIKQTIRRLPRSTKKEGGIHVEEMAELLDFPSAEVMMTNLLGAPKIDEAAGEMAQARTKERLGDPLSDGSIEEAAATKTAMGRKSDFLEAVVIALGNQLGRKTLKGTQIRETVQKDLASRKLKDTLSPRRYLQAAIRAGNRGEKALIAGDMQTAYEEKMRQLVNFEMFRASEEMLEKQERFEKFVSRLTNKAIPRTSVDPLYIKNLKSFAAGLNNIPRQRDFLESIIDWANSKVNSVDEPSNMVVPVDLSFLEAEDIRSMTFDQAQELNAFLKSMWTEGRQFSDQNSEVFKAIDADFSQRVLDNVKGTARKIVGKSTAAKAAGNMLEGYFSAHVAADQYMRQMDAYEEQGAIWSALKGRAADMENAEIIMKEQRVPQLKAIFNKHYTRKEQAQNAYKKVQLPEPIYANGNKITVLTKAELLALAQHRGNDYNMQAVAEGYGVDVQTIERILDATMQRRDWEFTQDMWDFLDSFWPELKALEERVTGVAPAKVEPQMFQTKYGTYRGGYSPLVYDRDLSSNAASNQQAEQLRDLMGGAYGRAGTKHGFLKSRTSSGGLPPRLNLSVLFNHVDFVIHDLTHREGILDMNRIINGHRFKSAIEEKLGTAAHTQIKNWLIEIGAGQVQAHGAMDKIVRGIRANSTVLGLGLRLSSIAVQPLGLASSVVRLGGKPVADGIRRFYRNPKQSWDFISEKSPFMRARLSNFDRDVRLVQSAVEPSWVDNTLARMGVTAIKRDEVAAAGFAGIAIMDYAVAGPTWMGAYAKGMKDFDGDEAKAIKYADAIVVESQGGGGAKDLVGIQRGPEMQRLLTMFFSYFIRMHQLVREQVKRSQLDSSNDASISSWELAMNLVVLWVIPSLLDGIIRGDTPDDDEEWYWWAARRTAGYAGGTLVGVRDIVGAMTSDYKHSMTPVAGSLNSIVVATKSFSDGELSDWEAQQAVRAIGLITGLPTDAPYKQVDYIIDVLNGEEDLTWRGLIFGKREE